MQFYFNIFNSYQKYFLDVNSLKADKIELKKTKEEKKNNFQLQFIFIQVSKCISNTYLLLQGNISKEAIKVATGGKLKGTIDCIKSNGNTTVVQKDMHCNVFNFIFNKGTTCKRKLLYFLSSYY